MGAHGPHPPVAGRDRERVKRGNGMEREELELRGIPCTVWGRPSDSAYVFVHGKMASREAAAAFAVIAEKAGYQTLSFDLPGHGERKAAGERCDIWNGVRDLNIAGEYAFSRWKRLGLYGCSLGAYFSLNAYAEKPFRKCLFQSPVADMEYLIRQMMNWFSVTPERLEREKEIETPVDLMTWEYYRYVLAHPAEKWNVPTEILFAEKDSLQSEAVIRRFAERFGCGLTVAPGCEHPFMAPEDEKVVNDWLEKHIRFPEGEDLR